MSEPKLSAKSEDFLAALRKFERHLDNHGCDTCLTIYAEVSRKLKDSVLWETIFLHAQKGVTDEKEQEKKDDWGDGLPKDDPLKEWD